MSCSTHLSCPWTWTCGGVLSPHTSDAHHTLRMSCSTCLFGGWFRTITHMSRVRGSGHVEVCLSPHVTEPHLTWRMSCSTHPSCPWTWTCWNTCWGVLIPSVTDTHLTWQLSCHTHLSCPCDLDMLRCADHPMWLTHTYMANILSGIRCSACPKQPHLLCLQELAGFGSAVLCP